MGRGGHGAFRDELTLAANLAGVLGARWHRDRGPKWAEAVLPNTSAVRDASPERRLKVRFLNECLSQFGYSGLLRPEILFPLSSTGARQASKPVDFVLWPLPSQHLHRLKNKIKILSRTAVGSAGARIS